MIKEDIKEILEECKDDKEAMIAALEELVTDKECELAIELDKLMIMMLPPNIFWCDFSERLSNLISKDLDSLIAGKGTSFETFLKIGQAVQIFILKVLIEMKIKTGKEIDCSI